MNWITNSVLPKIKAWVKSDDVPENLWVKCSACNQMIFHREFEIAYNCCSTCGHHAPLAPASRFAMTFDDGAFDMISLPAIEDDPLKFRDSKKYSDRLRDTRSKTGLNDAIAVAAGKVNGYPCVIAAFDFRFMGGSMGRMVGNGIIAAANEAVSRKAALITVPSTGGARMQEGVLSLMQLPRTIVAVDKVRDAGLPYLVLLAHPTTGGVTASFAMLGDIQIAEPGAIIGFAGRRVIEETVREKLPEDFQTAEYLMDHGMVDAVVARSDQAAYIGKILDFLMGPKGTSKAA
ncbi:MAG: acetyl-CoA carboxylase carboxyltransferase subunit beta [Candidatus Puniceispirillum sp.]|jgi:acetyl-CoA carboxylase carboxyl transferase subunit beta|nr:acetyl-CoA carboxylase carboxyltransferase subunit beta [Candidatus Puniceispirillum sp.]MBL6673321.1 acetyl-CoA carboxylase carboxyltransferase subunit beta [Candidatus Puniceispirillum sp.]